MVTDGLGALVTPSRTAQTREVLGEKGRRVREATSVVQKRIGLPENSVLHFAEIVNCASCEMAWAES